jgi:hypothetical protein
MDATIVTTAAGDLVTQLTPVAVAGVGVAVAILVVKRGVGLIKSLAK